MRSVAVTFALLAAATPVIAGCGGNSDETAPARTSQSGLAAADQRRMVELRTQLLGWNNTARLWVEAYESGDPKRFLRVHDKQVPLLRKAVAGIRHEVSGVEHPQLHRLLTASTGKYRAEVNLMVEMADRVRAGDIVAADALVSRLRDLAFSADEYSEEIRRLFPELAGER